MAEEKKKGFFGEFKEFISRGNVVDMAVGIIMGSSFTAIVTSLVNQVIMPAIGYITGGINFSDFKIVLAAATETEAEVAILYGAFIQTIINFLIVAFCVFLMVKGINKLHHKKEEPAPEPAPEPEPEPTPADILLLQEIRDLLKEKK